MSISEIRSNVALLSIEVNRIKRLKECGYESLECLESVQEALHYWEDRLELEQHRLDSERIELIAMQIVDKAPRLCYT
jgi:hypothetical protein